MMNMGRRPMTNIPVRAGYMAYRIAGVAARRDITTGFDLS